MGSWKPAGAGGEVDFKGEKRKNQTHESERHPRGPVVDEVPRQRGELSYMGHVMMENRTAYLWQTFLTEARLGRAEPDAALLMAEALPAGKASDVRKVENHSTRENSCENCAG